MRLAFAAIAALLAACGAVLDSAPVAGRADPEPVPPPADDAPEPGLQGQVPIAQQLGRLPGAVNGGLNSYRRGTRLVPAAPLGMYDVTSQRERGGNFEMAWLDDCAYIGVGDPARQALNESVLEGSGPPLPSAPAPTTAAQPDGGCGEDPCHPPDPPPDLPGAGIAIVSARNPREPSLVYVMQQRITPRSPSVGGPSPQPPSELRTSTATANPWEALHANEARRLILAGTANEIVVYQAVYNCKYPSRRAIVNVAPFMAHNLRIAPDGLTAYLADQNVDGESGIPLLAALDLTDVRAPAVIASFAAPDLGPAGLHGIDISPDGLRAYVTYASGTTRTLGNPAATGVLVLDLSEVQARLPGAQLRELGRLEWDGAAHSVRRARIGAHDYLLVADSQGLPGLCGWGWGRVLDLADDAAPTEIATIALQVSDPAHCTALQPDVATYSAHSVSVDDPLATRYAFFGWSNSGLRVFDLSDPHAPREVAYYNPPPNPDTLYHTLSTSGGLMLDATLSAARWRPETGHLWFTSVGSGFHILEFTRSMGPVP